MIDSVGTPDQRFRLGARTWRGVAAQAGVIAVGSCLIVVLSALAFGWSDWLLAVGFIFFLSVWLLILAVSAEWTIADHELRRRRWLSRPGSEPFLVMALGPQVEMVHENRLMWRVVPEGPALGPQVEMVDENRVVWRVVPEGPALGVQPWQAQGLVEAMEQAGVRIDDWRGDWAQRHRSLDILGLLVLWGGLVGIIVMPALRAEWPGSVTATAGLVCSGAVFLGLAIDWLPWSVRNTWARNK